MKIFQVTHTVIFSLLLSPISALAQQDIEQSSTAPRKVKEVINLLQEAGTASVLLRGEDKNKVVVVTPDLAGRVLCSGFDGIEGETESCLYPVEIRKGVVKSRRGGTWAAFGGEERLWFAPEGGIFGLFYKNGESQIFKNYLVPESLNSALFRLIGQNGKSVTFATPLNLVNYRGNQIDLEVVRTIQVVDDCPYTLGYADKVEFVGFESKTCAKNIGRKPLTKQTGTVAIWTLGEFWARDHSVVILPFRPGPDSELGEPLNTTYFKTDMIDITQSPKGYPYDNYWKVEDDFALIKANGSVRTKIEMSPKRALGKIASINLANFTMTVVEFRIYPRMDYVASYWLPYEGNPFEGAAISIFVEKKGLGFPPIYELEALSPALFLQPNEQYCHISRTYHLRGDKDAITEICEKNFNADFQTLTTFDQNSP